MKNIQHKRNEGSNSGRGLWHRLRERWFSGLNLPALGLGHVRDSANDERIKVWDRHRACYRYVDLNDRADPLWSAAYSLASFHRESDSRRPAA